MSRLFSDSSVLISGIVLDFFPAAQYNDFIV